MSPFFYHPELTVQQKRLVLDEATSKHCIQVLRMTEGAHILLTDGKGLLAETSISIPERKRCEVVIQSVSIMPPKTTSFTLAIAFTKNTSRNEWLLEKITELGCDHIIPLQCIRSEKNKYNEARWKNILTAAMLQSQQCYLPELHPLTPFKQLLQAGKGQKLIAHCIEGTHKQSLLASLQKGSNTLILIGPEGDFTAEEIAQALHSGYQAVSLGPTRLRTETAGMYACTLFNAINYE